MWYFWETSAKAKTSAKFVRNLEQVKTVLLKMLLTWSSERVDCTFRCFLETFRIHMQDSQNELQITTSWRNILTILNQTEDILRPKRRTVLFLRYFQGLKNSKSKIRLFKDPWVYWYSTTPADPDGCPLIISYGVCLSLETGSKLWRYVLTRAGNRTSWVSLGGKESRTN